MSNNNSIKKDGEWQKWRPALRITVMLRVSSLLLRGQDLNNCDFSISLRSAPVKCFVAL